jgi:hypothetical protein
MEGHTEIDGQGEQGGPAETPVQASLVVGLLNAGTITCLLKTIRYHYHHQFNH